MSGYSRIVRFLRLGLPLAALGLLAAVFFSGRPSVETTELMFRTGQIAALQSGMRLTNPRFTGETAAGEPMLLRADWAEPDSPDPEKIALSGIRGSIEMRGGRAIAVTAVSGEMLPKAKEITLADGVVIETSDGYRFETSGLSANLETKTMASAGAVEGAGPLGAIKAGAMRIDDAEAGVVVFTDRVTLVITQAAQ